MPTPTASTSFHGAVAAPHAAATEAAVAAYRDGGSAIDAAIAAAAVLTVVYPHNVALGGDLIALVRTPDGAVTCVNASGWAAAAVDVPALRGRHGTALPVRGADTVTVPGGVRGWEALRGFGSRLDWSRLLEPAQRIAHDGVEVPQSLATHLADPENADLIGVDDFAAVFCPAGRALTAGEELRQPALAQTFAALRSGGPEEFYAGELGRRSVQYLQDHGSAVTPADFADFTADITAPIAVDFRGLTVWTSPPNSHGFAMLRALRAIADLGIGAPLGADVPTLMQLFRQGNALRDRYLADPRMAAVDVSALLSTDVPAATGHAQAGSLAVPAGDTVGVAAADSDGVAVSLIQSVYHAFGSGLVDPQTGILFHDRGTGFDLDPRSPNVVAGRKRPRHTLMPALTTENGALRHVLATMGGQGQPQILTQILLRLLDGAGAAQAVAAPRAIVGRQTLHSTDDSVVVEEDFDQAATAALTDSGLDLVAVPASGESSGQANVVTVDRDGALTAATDPRSDGAASVVHYVRHRRAG